MRMTFSLNCLRIFLAYTDKSRSNGKWNFKAKGAL